jgi:4-hydroxybenzoate polyprenyltransferase
MNFAQRLWIYQRERFPVFKQGSLIIAFGISGVLISSLLRGAQQFPSTGTQCIAVIIAFCFFLHLRIADEFKDYEEDCRYRPTRPVPRGLVSRTELGCVGLFCLGIQCLLAYLLNPKLIWVLCWVFAYQGLMSVEFFVSDWLKPKLLLYLFSHMLIMPLIDLFVTACDWLTWQNTPPQGLWFFLAFSFANGLVIELGRKTWAPEQERQGVESYSDAWGYRTAALAWLMALGAAVLLGIRVSRQILFFKPVLGCATVLLALGMCMCYGFLRHPTAKRAKHLENFSGVFVLLMYVILGPVAMGYFVWLD